MNFSQIANSSADNLQEQTILKQKLEIDKLNGLVLKLNEENQRNHEKIMRAETLKKENGELIQQAENLSQTNSELQKTISGQREKINLLTADLRKAVNKPPKTVVKHSYYKRCHECNIDSVKEKLKEKSEFLRDTLISVLIFLVALTLKNNILRNDIVSFVMSLWNGILLIGKEVINFANDVSIFAYKIENETIAIILYWIIKILVILLLVALIAVICCLTVYFTVKLIKEKWDTLQSVISVLTITAVIYLSDLIDIKQFLNINIVFLTIIIIFTEIAARVFYTKKNRY